LADVAIQQWWINVLEIWSRTRYDVMMVWWYDDTRIQGYKDIEQWFAWHQSGSSACPYLVGFLSGNVCYIFSRVYRQHFWVSMDSKGSSFYLGLYVFTTVLVWQIQFQIVKRQTAKHQPKLLPFIKQKKSTTKILISSQYMKLHGLVKKVC
jgi:hypothetical protein